MTQREQQEFPDQALAPESVWDYPRPPKVEPTRKRIRVEFAGEVVADTQRAVRVLENGHPPVYYIPQADIREELLLAGPRHTFCEFKGTASYWTRHYTSLAD